MRIILVNAVLLFLFFSYTAPTGALPRITVFDFELIDNSLDREIYGTAKAEKERLFGLANNCAKRWPRSGHFEVADIGPVKAEARGGNLKPAGNAMPDSRKLGAGFSITGTVQKVSNLI